MALPQYSRVMLTTDRFGYEGDPRGSVGYILEAYVDGDYEVEASDPKGITIAQVVAREEDLELAGPSD